jgi:hypothetical protein
MRTCHQIHRDSIQEYEIAQEQYPMFVEEFKSKTTGDFDWEKERKRLSEIKSKAAKNRAKE